MFGLDDWVAGVSNRGRIAVAVGVWRGPRRATKPAWPHEERGNAMFGLDDWVAGLSNGGSIAVVVAVAVLLGLRHATDPDHIAAVTTLVASGRARANGVAARPGA